MSMRGGIYEGPGGELLHGDGRSVEKQTPDVDTRIESASEIRLKALINNHWVVGLNPSKGFFNKYICSRTHGGWPGSVIGCGPTPEDAIDAAISREAEVVAIKAEETE